MYSHWTPSVRAALDIRKARTAEYLALPATQRAEVDRANSSMQETAHVRRVRARAAYLSGRPAPQPRRHRRDAPRPSRQYATISTEAARDPRLVAGAVKLVVLLSALCGSTGFTDAHNGALAGAIKVHISTVQRYIAELERFGYLTRELRHNARGSVVCRRIRLAAKTWPEWHRNRGNPHKHCHRSGAVPVTHKAKQEEASAEKATVPPVAASEYVKNMTLKYIHPKLSETTD